MRGLFAVAVSIVIAGTPGLSQEKAKVDPQLAELAGVWKVASTSGHGIVVVAAGNKDEFGRPLWGDSSFTIADDQLITVGEPVVLSPAQPDVGLYFAIHAGSEFRLKLGKADGKGPTEIDVILKKGIILKGIYERNGDELKLCFANWMALPGPDEEKMAKGADSVARPTGFSTKEGGAYVSYVLKRAPK